MTRDLTLFPASRAYILSCLHSPFYQSHIVVIGKNRLESVILFFQGHFPFLMVQFSMYYTIYMTVASPTSSTDMFGDLSIFLLQDSMTSSVRYLLSLRLWLPAKWRRNWSGRKNMRPGEHLSKLCSDSRCSTRTFQSAKQSSMSSSRS